MFIHPAFFACRLRGERKRLRQRRSHSRPDPRGGADTTEASALATEALSPGQTSAPTAAPTAAREDEFLVFDIDGSYATNTSEMIFESRDTVYYMLGGDGRTEYRMYFTDKEYRDWMPLCGRPDCLHKNYECNAYLGDDLGGSIIWPYGDHFYFFIHRYHLLSTFQIDAHRKKAYTDHA